jgi:hypothetical protein
LILSGWSSGLAKSVFDFTILDNNGILDDFLEFIVFEG